MARQKVEESVPVQEIKTPTMVSVRRFIKSIFVVLLSFFCIFVGVLIYQMSNPIDPIKPQPTRQQPAIPRDRTSVVFKKPVSPVLKVQPEQKAIPQPKEETEKKAETISSPVLTPPPVDIPVLDPTPNQKTVEETPKQQLPVPQPQKPSLMLAEVLQLRDHLATGESCLADLKIVMAKETPNPTDRETLIEKLMPVCTVRSVFNELENTFYKNRRQALITYYRLNNPLWLAYLKTFGTSLVDIRKLNPSKEKPKDIISSAQNALAMKNVEEALTRIQTLPGEVKAEFNEFIGQADTYVAAQKEAERLVLSFGRKGE